MEGGGGGWGGGGREGAKDTITSISRSFTGSYAVDSRYLESQGTG